MIEALAFIVFTFALVYVDRTRGSHRTSAHARSFAHARPNPTWHAHKVTR